MTTHEGLSCVREQESVGRRSGRGAEALPGAQVGRRPARDQAESSQFLSKGATGQFLLLKRLVDRSQRAGLSRRPCLGNTGGTGVGRFAPASPSARAVTARRA